MKVGSDANYNVRVFPRGWGEPEGRRPLYDGMYTFGLNQVVEVAFIPRVSAAGPPWSIDDLPAEIEEFITPEQVRILEVLTAAYSVTPDEDRAGTVEQVEWPFEWPPDYDLFYEPGDPKPTPTVFFVTDEEWARLAADLEALTEIAGSVHSTVRRDKVADHEAITFIDRRILDSPWLTANDAASVGRQREAK